MGKCSFQWFPSLNFTYLWPSYFSASAGQSLIGKHNQEDVFSPNERSTSRLSNDLRLSFTFARVILRLCVSSHEPSGGARVRNCNRCANGRVQFTFAGGVLMKLWFQYWYTWHWGDELASPHAHFRAQQGQSFHFDRPRGLFGSQLSPEMGWVCMQPWQSVEFFKKGFKKLPSTLAYTIQSKFSCMPKFFKESTSYKTARKFHLLTLSSELCVKTNLMFCWFFCQILFHQKLLFMNHSCSIFFIYCVKPCELSFHDFCFSFILSHFSLFLLVQ